MDIEMVKFVDKLKESRSELYIKLGFMNEHNFKQESIYLSDKIRTITVILDGLEMIIGGKKSSSNITFNWD